jgi:hypothetical protein
MESTMSFIFRGRLEGDLCSACCESLSYVTVRLYRRLAGANATALAVGPQTTRSRCSPMN